MAAQNPTYQLARFLLFLGITLIFSFLSGTAYSANLTLAWDANNEPDLLGYHVFCGESSGNYTINHDITSSDPNDPPPTTCEFTGLEEGKEYYFAAIAYSENGQSDYSQEISYTVPMAQNDPDTDQDGYTTAQGDCNDSDPAVHPGAEEICGDGIDQNCSGADFACPDDHSLVRDAETGVLSGAFEIGSDPVASSGQYVYVPNGVGTRFDGPDETHKITYTFNLLEEGTYRIKGTVYAANGSDDSFWVKVNDNPAGGYLWDVLQNTGYLQDYVNDRNGADPVEVWLPVGENTVTVYLREDGTRLDRIELEPVATAAPVSDEDGDGYTESQGDCDDNSATVYPGADEICSDGIDQNCDGTDIDCKDIDEDGDGITENQGDCNDSDPAIHPGGEEICGDGIDQDCSGADIACPDDRSLIRDAQTGVLSGAFEIGSDPATSSGQYVYVPNGVGTRFDGPDETHKITYTFNLLEEGTYRIKGTVYAANGSDDSFWVKVNDNPAGGYLWDVLQNTGYLQDYVNDRNGADPVEVSLKVGLNTVTVYLREDGTRLGTIELEPVATAAPVADEDGDGYTESQGDCDDNSATVYPGAEDTCGDGIDQDCNGSDLTCVDLTKDSDNDGLTDYEEENTYFTDPNKADTDGDGFSDGEEVAGGFDPNNTESKPDPRTSELPMEFGEIELDHQWKTVTLNRSFDEPVVITGAISYAQQDPAVIRVRNVNHNSFDVRVQEWDYLDGQHATEQVSYIVVESGTHDLAGGARVEAGRFNANAVSSFASIEFSQAFNSVPVVLTTINSVNESDAVVMRLKNITTTGFDYRIQEQESNDKQHAPETAGYIAWEPSAGSMDGFMFEIGRTSNSVTHQFQSLPFDVPFTGPPVFLAGMQTTDGSDTAAVRWQGKQATGVEVKVEEEQSRDTETNHTTEVIGYVVFEAENATQDDTQPTNGLVLEAEDGDIEGAFEIVSDPAASGGQYIHVPNGTGTRFSGPDESHKISYTFYVPGAGTYRIKGAVYAANTNDNSFWIRVNDSPTGGYLWDVLQNSGYQQDYVNDRYGADPVEVSLGEGPNTITVYLREDGTRLDKIELEPVD